MNVDFLFGHFEPSQRERRVMHHVSGVSAAVVLVCAMTGRAAGQCMQWDSSAQLPPGFGTTFTYVLTSFDSGSGPVMYANEDGFVRRWTGTAWVTVGSFDDDVYALCGYDDGSGPALYAGGIFTHYGSTIPIAGIARRVGNSWQSVGAGIPASVVGVLSLAVFDDGTGSKLYVGGMFDSAGTLTDSILAWDGVAWTGLGTGLVGTTPPNVLPVVSAMCVYDDGGGPALFVGGIFGTATGIPADNIAKWDGSTWSAMGSGVTVGGQFTVARKLVVYDDGSGPALYVGGTFALAGGVPANGIAKWDGTSWSSIPGVGQTPPGNSVFALGTHDDGNGPALYASGAWTAPPPGTPGGLLRFDGSSWSALGGGLAGASALLSFDDGQGRGPALVVGGSFNWFVGGNLIISNVARWFGCTQPIASMCFGDGTFAPCPCSNYGTIYRGCRNSAAAGGAWLSCTGATSPDTLTLISSSEPPTSLSVFLQSDTLRPAPRTLDDGILCLGGNVRRLYAKSAVGGVAEAPTVVDPPISQRSAALGDVIAPGTVRYYQVWYRDGAVGYCTPDLFNISNGLRVVW